MQSLLKFREFIQEINLENGRLYKTAVLEKYKEDEDIKYYLEFVFNPYKVTGISQKKLDKTFDLYKYSIVDHEVFDSVKSLLEYILVNNTGTDIVLRNIQMFMRDNFSKYECEDALENLLENIISKNIILGVDVKTINKVIPKLISTFNVQLANKYFDKPSLVDGKEFTITTKLDGNRIIALKRDGVVKFYTRQGKEYEGLVDLETELSTINLDNICLDGELIADRKVGQDSKDQFTETQKLARTKDKNKHGLKMRVFDIMTADQFIEQQCNTCYKERRQMLQQLFDDYSFSYFVNVPVLYSGNDTSMIIKLLTQEMNNGEEGVMININDAPYVFDRCNTLLKVKKMKDVDLEVIGFESGKNKYEGTLGALLVNYNGFTVKVGSGISDELREEIWNNQEEWLGRTIIVQYFEETKNQQGELSLRFPVYIDWREDK